MKTIRIRLNRVALALGFATLCALVVMKSAMDSAPSIEIPSSDHDQQQQKHAREAKITDNSGKSGGADAAGAADANPVPAPKKSKSFEEWKETGNVKDLRLSDSKHTLATAATTGPPAFGKQMQFFGGGGGGAGSIPSAPGSFNIPDAGSDMLARPFLIPVNAARSDLPAGAPQQGGRKLTETEVDQLMGPGAGAIRKPFGPNDPLIAGAGAGIGANGSLAGGRSDYPLIKDGKFIPPHRVVHFDLKGAPPKDIEYIKDLFKLISQMGATGVLLEWEDMYPYKEELEITNNGNHYSEDEIRRVLKSAKEHGLEVIPLVQTFGHLEWILKFTEFADLREVERYPQVICLSNNKSVNLVKKMIDQVLRLHPDLKYFHMGADEAFQVGMCDRCQKRIQELGGNREKLMLKQTVEIEN